MDEIVETLARGELVVMRSDTVYGIFAAALNESAIKKLHTVRERDPKRGFIVLVDSVKTVAKLIKISDEVSKRLTAIWRAQASTSVILPVNPPNSSSSGLTRGSSNSYPWLADTRESEPTICVRVPNDENLRKLLAKTGPLAAPSANPPDQLVARNIAEARAYFGDRVSLYVDGGGCDNTVPSRIIKFDDQYRVETVRSDGRDHPEDFVITRRRKLYKFARFDAHPNCFQIDEWRGFLDCCPEKLALSSRAQPRDLVSESPHQAKDSSTSAQNDELPNLVVEIGAGSALFSVELARRHPEKTFVAVDIKSDRLYQGARAADDLNLKNIYFVRSDIAQITEIIPPHTADEIWLTFPDPWPPKSDARHRLTAPRYLAYYRQILVPHGILHFKTDNQPLFDWSLEQFKKNHWTIANLTRDLHNSNLSADSKILTSYEQKFVKEGLPICYLDAKPNL